MKANRSLRTCLKKSLFLVAISLLAEVFMFSSLFQSVVIGVIRKDNILNQLKSSSDLASKHIIVANKYSKKRNLFYKKWSFITNRLTYLNNHVGQANISNTEEKTKVSILFHFIGNPTLKDERYLNNFINSMDKSRFDVILLIAGKSRLNILAERKHFSVFHFMENNVKDVLLKVVRSLQNKYILIAHQMYLNNDLNFIDKVLPGKDDFVIGLPFVDANNIWDLGCYQTRTLWYQYRIIKGYDRLDPIRKMVLCDFITGPFIVEKMVLQDFLESIRREDLRSSEEVYLDFFQNTMNINVGVCLQCPYAVARHFPFQPVTVDDNNFWQKFLRKNRLSEVILSGRNARIKFTCAQIHLTSCSSVDSTFLPPKCCIEELHQLLKNSASFFFKEGYHINLDGGTAIGSTKLMGTLPWEKDHDIELSGYKIKQLWEKRQEFKEQYGYTIREDKRIMQQMKSSNCLENNEYPQLCGYLGIHSQHWRLEVGGRNMIFSDYLRKGLNYTRPKTRLKGNVTLSQLDEDFWVPTVNNPGRYLRVSYGLDVLRHIKHTIDTKSSGRVDGYFQTVTSWGTACSQSGHHACTDNFLPDGNLQFRDVWL